MGLQLASFSAFMLRDQMQAFQGIRVVQNHYDFGKSWKYYEQICFC